MKALLRSLLFAAGVSTVGLPITASADDGAERLLEKGFSGPRYEELWTKSPFAVASAEDGGVDSPEYVLVGIGQFDSVAYASLIDKKTQEHFTLSSEKSERGLKLVSIAQGKTTNDAVAVIQKNGESLRLKLDTTVAAVAAGATTAGAPGVLTPKIPMPGAVVTSSRDTPPATNVRRRSVRIPSQPGTSAVQPVKAAPVPQLPPTGQ